MVEFRSLIFRKQLTAHVAVWFGIASLVALAHYHGDQNHLPLYRNIFPLFLASLAFYSNYYGLIPSLLFRRKVLLFMTANFIVGLIMGYAHELLRERLSFPIELDPLRHMPRHVLVLRGVFSMYLFASVAVAVRMTARWYQSESEKRALETERLRSEVAYLKLQLSPHFLFNTLNNIHALVSIDPKAAERSVLNLSRMLRYLLYETRTETVPLREEIGFLESYFQIMRLRLPSQAQAKLDIKIENHEYPIAPMLLLPLVENAFKHGVHPQEACHIVLFLEERQGSIYCEVRNSNFPQKDHERRSSGVGVANLAKRLDLHYPGRYRYTNGLTNGEYRVELELMG